MMCWLWERNTSRHLKYSIEQNSQIIQKQEEMYSVYKSIEPNTAT